MANDIFDPLLYNAHIRTDTSSVWVLVLQGNFSPPKDCAYEVFYYYGKDYVWPTSYLTECQRSIPTLPDSPYKVFISTDISDSLPLTYQRRTYNWYHAQAPVEQWSPLMHAMTIAGVGYAILDIPLKVFPFRPPPKPKVQWSQLVGGTRKEITYSDYQYVTVAIPR